MKRILTLLPLALMIACSTSPETEALDTLCKELFPAGEPGAAVLVMKGDDILFDKGYGLADLETRAPIDGNTFFNIASVSKQFTAVAVLQLAEAGKLSLDDAVAMYFPFRHALWKEVRIKHLLSHSSGVPDGRGYLTREEKIKADDALSMEYLAELDHLHFLPGTAYEYINPTYTLCGKLVEIVSGQPFEEYMAEHVFRPSGMERTLYFNPDRQDLIPNMAHSYLKDEDWKEYDYGEETFFATRPDGGIYTSTHEFVNWEKALREDSVLSEASRTDAHTPHIPVSGSPWSTYQNHPNTWYGYGWFIEPASDSTREVIYHTGDNGCFKAFAARYPADDALVLVFANRDDWDRYALMQQIEKIFGF